MDHAVDDGGERSKEVGRVDFRVKEDFGREETLVAYVDGGGGTAAHAGDGVFLETIGVGVEAREFFDNVGRDVAEFFLDALGGLEGGVGLAALAEEGLHKVGDVAAGDGDRLDGGTDDIALCYGNYVGDAVSRVDNCSGEGAVGDLVGCPGSSESEDGLDGNVKTGAVEGLKHDFCGIFAGLGGVEWRLGQEKVVVFGLDAEVFEDGGLPETLHVVLVVCQPLSSLRCLLDALYGLSGHNIPNSRSVHDG